MGCPEAPTGQMGRRHKRLRHTDADPNTCKVYSLSCTSMESSKSTSFLMLFLSLKKACGSRQFFHLIGKNVLEKVAFTYFQTKQYDIIQRGVGITRFWNYILSSLFQSASFINIAYSASPVTGRTIGSAATLRPTEIRGPLRANGPFCREDREAIDLDYKVGCNALWTKKIFLGIPL